MDQNNPRIPSSSSSSSSKVERKTVEKNRRNQMKHLFDQLNSLIPRHHGSTSQEDMSVAGQIEEATKYIKKMEAVTERLRQKKNSLMRSSNWEQHRSNSSDCGQKVAQIEVHLVGDSALQITLITGADCPLIFTEAIRVLHDEGVEVVNASFSTMDDSTAYHTIHAKIAIGGECSERQVAVARISERLNRVCNS